MDAARYIDLQLNSGRLTKADLITMVQQWQYQAGLEVDGRPGPATLSHLRKTVWPLAPLEDGRKPSITSHSRWYNDSRSTHNGVDLFYRWTDDDPAVPTGDGGAITKKGKRRWWYPPDTKIRAAAFGVVQQVRSGGTGWIVWLAHGDTYRTGYMHCSRVLVTPGQFVAPGQAIALPGDNPKQHDAKHLHFEVSESLDHYRPVAPEIFLAEAKW